MVFLPNFNTGIYVHIPFCKSKCYYCDYCSITTDNKKNEYFEAMERELVYYSQYYKEIVNTLYIGGGTPSYTEDYYIKNIIDSVNEKFNFIPEEITIEVNPDSITKEKLRYYSKLGVNRISCGIQSTDDEILSKSGRTHNFAKAVDAVNILKNETENYNLDFILGLPGDNIQKTEKNIKFISEYMPDHVSYYVYDNSHDTVLSRKIKNKTLNLPEDDFIDEALDYIYSELESIGYKRYEISNWALNSRESFHNKIYWKNENYIGIGMAAGSYINRIRTVNTENIFRYIKYSDDNRRYKYYEKNDKKRDFTETLFMGLRMLSGIELQYLEERYNEKNFMNSLYKLVELQPELIKIDNSIKLTSKGLNISNIVFEKIIEILENIL